MTEFIFGLIGGEVLSLWNSQPQLSVERGKFPNSIHVFANTFVFHSLDDMGEIFFCWCLSYPGVSARPQFPPAGNPDFTGPDFLSLPRKAQQAKLMGIEGTSQRMSWAGRDPWDPQSPALALHRTAKTTPGVWQHSKTSGILAGEIHRGETQRKT